MTEQNSENNKRIAKNTLFLYFRMLFLMAVSLYTSRIVLDALGEIDFGIYNVVGGFVTMFIVISGSMTTATQRFLSFEIGKGENGNVKQIFSTAVIIHILLALTILILAETFGLWFVNSKMNFPPNRYIAANWVFQFSLLTFLVNVISVPYNAAIIAYERMKVFAYVSIVEAILKLIIVYLIMISEYDKLIVYAILLSAIAVSIRIISGIYCSRNIPQCKCNYKWNKSFGSNILSFVSWNLIGSAAVVAKEQGTNVLLNMFFGASVNAARGIASQVLNALSGFVNNFQLAMNPQIVKMYANREREEMFKLVIRGSKYSFFMMLFLSLPVIVEAPFILSVWLKIVPDYTIIFLRLVLLISLVDSLSRTLITSMHASGKVRDYQIVVGGLSLLTLPIAYLCLNLDLPPQSVMIVSFIITILCHFARLILLKKSIDFPMKRFIKEVTLKCFYISILSMILPLIVKHYVLNNILGFILVCLVSCISTILYIYILGLSNNEKLFLKKKLSNIYYKYKRK